LQVPLAHEARFSSLLFSLLSQCGFRSSAEFQEHRKDARGLRLDKLRTELAGKVAEQLLQSFLRVEKFKQLLLLRDLDREITRNSVSDRRRVAVGGEGNRPVCRRRFQAASNRPRQAAQFPSPPTATRRRSQTELRVISRSRLLRSKNYSNFSTRRNDWRSCSATFPDRSVHNYQSQPMSVSPCS